MNGSLRKERHFQADGEGGAPQAKGTAYTEAPSLPELVRVRKRQSLITEYPGGRAWL